MSKKIFFLLLLAISVKLAGAQTFRYDNPKEYEIADITVSGVKYLNTNTLIQLSGLYIGKRVTVPGEDITNVIEKLWSQGLFSDIEVAATKIEGDKIYLDIFLTERPRLSDFEIRGVKKTEAKDLEEKINLVRGNQVTDNIIINTKNIIHDHFVEKGFFKNEVRIVQQEDTAMLNTVKLIINVDKKEKIKINAITVEGNTVFSDKKVRRHLKETKIKRWYGFFKPSKYIPETYEEDLANLMTKYNEKGYRDAEVVKDTLYDYDENTINIHLTVSEGRQYFYRSISWSGNTKYSSQQLSKTLGIKKGDVYDQVLLDERLTYDEDAVGNLYMNNGYLFYHVVPTETAIVNDSIDIQMRIYEGKQATVNRVTISGNTKTNDHVVLREIRTTPGELFSKRDITRTIRELAQLGHFDPEKLNVNPIPDMANGTVDLEYLLEERANDQIEISGGWGANMIVGTIGLSFNNFSAANIFKKDGWRPIPSGDGQSLRLNVRSSGRYYQSYSLTFIEPWLGGRKPNSFSSSIYRNVQSNGKAYSDPNRTSMIINGVALGLGRRLKWPDDYFTLYHELSFQNYDLKDWSYFLITNGISNNLSLTTKFGRNSLDNPLYTRNGASIDVSLQITPPYSLFDNVAEDQYAQMESQDRFRWIEYHKWKFNADWFTSIVGDFVVRARAQFGFLGYYNKDLQSPFEGFQLGGDGMTGYNLYGSEMIALKGYENNSLTPANGGNLYNRFTFELRYPISLNPQATIYGKVFLESGNAWTHFKDFNPFNSYRSAGVGLRFILPMIGLMGIDWGYGFDQIPGNPGANGANWHFILGQEF